MKRLAVYEPELTEEDATAAATAVRDGFVAAGPSIVAFEDAWAKRCGMRHAVSVSSGTAALELAVRALGVGPGDEVICPSFTIISCVRAIVLAGATPVLVDVDRETFNLDPLGVPQRISPRTRAILAVDMYGHPYDPRIDELARDRGIPVIEDAAQAHGATRTDGPCGGLGSVSVFSFYANKPVTTGEGGMVLARSDDVADRIRAYRNLSFGREQRFRHEELSGNHRLSNVAAAIGLSQLQRLDRNVERKRRVARLYRTRLPQLHFQAHQPWAQPIDWMVGVVLPLPAAPIAAALLSQGIETRPFFLGMHEQPVFAGRFAGERHPVTEELSRNGLYLPSSLHVDEAVVDRVASALEAALGR
jgi:perosamine synthetase